MDIEAMLLTGEELQAPELGGVSQVRLRGAPLEVYYHDARLVARAQLRKAVLALHAEIERRMEPEGPIGDNWAYCASTVLAEAVAWAKSATEAAGPAAAQ